MAKKGIINEVIAEAPNRRSFVRKLGLASAVVGAAATTRFAEADTAPAITDVDILNFALNLEYLEAEFYTVATTGMSIDQLGVNIAGSGNLGTTMGWNQVEFSTQDTTIQRVAMELASDERTHVKLLRGAIGSAGGRPIARPPINLGALGLGFGSEAEFLTLARLFEDIGVTAYGGAAPLIKDPGILGYAARILATEAEHSGNIRSMCERYQVMTPMLDGADVPPPPGGSLFFSTDSNAITQVRSPGEVLYLAFAGGDATKGGFFPDGVNGNLNKSSTMPASSDGNSLSANPNPIPAPAGGYGQTTLTWNAVSAEMVEVHVDAPNGPLFAAGRPSRSMQTGEWVTDGMKFFLQDTTGGKPLTADNTLATLVVKFKNSGPV